VRFAALFSLFSRKRASIRNFLARWRGGGRRAVERGHGQAKIEAMMCADLLALIVAWRGDADSGAFQRSIEGVGIADREREIPGGSEALCTGAIAELIGRALGHSDGLGGVEHGAHRRERSDEIALAALGPSIGAAPFEGNGREGQGARLLGFGRIGDGEYGHPPG